MVKQRSVSLAFLVCSTLATRPIPELAQVVYLFDTRFGGSVHPSYCQGVRATTESACQPVSLSACQREAPPDEDRWSSLKGAL